MYVFSAFDIVHCEGELIKETFIAMLIGIRWEKQVKDSCDFPNYMKKFLKFISQITYRGNPKISRMLLVWTGNNGVQRQRTFT